MLRFMFGVVVGAAGYWAYEQGMFSFGGAQSFDQVVANNDSQIIRPTAHEVASRPAEPIPS